MEKDSSFLLESLKNRLKRKFLIKPQSTMKPTQPFFLATTFAIALSSSVSAATLLNEYPNANSSNIVVTESSIEPSTSVNGGDRTVIEANSGFNSATGQHGNGTQSSWRSNNAQTLAEQWIQWDLGDTYLLDSIQVWNYNDNVRRAAGVRQVDIYFANSLSNPSSDPETGAFTTDWTLWAGNAILTPGTSVGGYNGFDLETVVGASLPTTTVRYVRFEVDSTFRSDSIDLNALDGNGGDTSDGTNVAALAQIEFTIIPEPSTTALLGLGGFAFLLRRRR